MTATAQTTVDPSEVEKFSRIAAEWWDLKGKFGILHVFNPVRTAYIKEQVAARFGRDPFDPEPFRGLRFLDIGCGGGLLSEPMARLGAAVVGVDAAEKNIKTAAVHAAEQGLSIDYRYGTAEELFAAGEKFDVILNMEVIEHVADPEGFVSACSGMLKPGGVLFMSTINRTLKSFALAIVGAEYVLRWLPPGTHHWEKFITPDELKGWLQKNNLQLKAESGVTFHPLQNMWKLSADLSVNYMLVSQRPPQPALLATAPEPPVPAAKKSSPPRKMAKAS